MNKINNIELGYFCGLVDGEGAVGISRNNCKKHQRYVPKIRIGMTHKETIKALSEIYGIGRTSTSHNGYGNKKPAYHFEINKLEHLLIILPLIIPHIITKKKQCELVLEYCKSRLVNPYIVYFNNKMQRIFPKRRPYNEREKQIVNELNILNLRGNNEKRIKNSGFFR